MSVQGHHHPVIKCVITLKEVLCALAVMGSCYIVTSDLVMVGYNGCIFELKEFLLLLDINECENMFPCDQLCANTIGSYECSCNGGYMLNGSLCYGQYICQLYSVIWHVSTIQTLMNVRPHHHVNTTVLTVWEVFSVLAMKDITLLVMVDLVMVR